MAFRNNLSQSGPAWTARTTVYVDGRARIRQKTFRLGENKDNLAMAKKWLSDQEGIRAGLSSFLSSGVPTNLGELVERYRGVVESDVQSVTWQSYERQFGDLLSNFGHSHHPLFSQQDIDWYIDQRRSSGAGRVIIKELSLLRSALTRFNIQPQWSIPKWLQRLPKRELAVPSIDEYHRLCLELPPGAIKALRMALYCGLRDQEVFRVGWESYTHSRAILRIDAAIRKVPSTNIVPVVRSVSDVLTPAGDSGPIVEWSKSCIKRDLTRSSQRAGVSTWFGLQPARRLFTVLAEENGWSQDNIGLVLGHSQKSMASRYSAGYGHLELKRKIIESVEERLQ